MSSERVRNLAGGALGHEDVAQRAFSVHIRLMKVSRSKAMPSTELLRVAASTAIDAFGGRREILGHTLDHVARTGSRHHTVGVLTAQVAHQRLGAAIGVAGGDLTRASARASIGTPRPPIGRTALTRQRLRSISLLTGSPRDGDHVELHLERQSTRGSRCDQRQEPGQLDFRAGHVATGRSDAVIAASASSKAPPMQAVAMAATTGLSEFLTARMAGSRLGSARAFGLPDSLMSASPGNLARAGDHDSADRRVGVSASPSVMPWRVASPRPLTSGLWR